MRLGLAILLNAAVLGVLLPWLWRQWQQAGTGWWRLALVGGLGVRVVVGLLRNWTMRLDAEFMNNQGHEITQQLWANPGQAWQLLTKPVTIIHIVNYKAVYQGMSNTWFLIKTLALLNFASLGLGWLNGLYVSVFAFLGCWQLARTVARVFPATPAGAGVVAFLLCPSVWFWATGLSKEALLLGSGAWFTALVLGRLYGMETAAPAGLAGVGRQLAWGLGAIGLAWLHFKMRYFFAAPLLILLAGVALARTLQQLGLARARWGQVAAVAAVLGLGSWLAPQLSVAFRINKFVNQVVRVYASDLPNLAGRPHFEYPTLQPTLESVLAHVPQAIANAMLRPWLGESPDPRMLVAGGENLLLLLLLAVAVVATGRGRPGHLPFILTLGLLVFCLVLAALMGLTTPNLGSLHRYRSDLIPYLLLLLLQNDYAAAALRRLGMGPGTDQNPS